MSHFMHNKNNVIKLLLVSLVLLVAGISCQQQPEETGVVDQPAPTTIIEFPPVIEEPATATPVAVIPTPIIFETATSIEEFSSETGADCVQGYWTVEPASLQTYAAMTILGSDLVDFIPSAVTGSNSILITYDQIFVVADNMQVDLSANNSTISIFLNGTVSAKYNANDSRFKVNTIVYDLAGTLVEPARTSTLDLNGLFNLARYLGFGLDYSKPPISEKVNYTCEGDLMTLDMNEHASLNLVRAQP